jgi:hypothetical protein
MTSFLTVYCMWQVSHMNRSFRALSHTVPIYSPVSSPLQRGQVVLVVPSVLIVFRSTNCLRIVKDRSPSRVSHCSLSLHSHIPHTVRLGTGREQILPYIPIVYDKDRRLLFSRVGHPHYLRYPTSLVCPYMRHRTHSVECAEVECFAPSVAYKTSWSKHAAYLLPRVPRDTRADRSQCLALSEG